MGKIDITAVKAPNSLGVITIAKPNWWMIVDKFTGLKWINFYVTQNIMVKPTCEFFQKCKDVNIPVKIFKSDNAVKNKKLEKRCISYYWNFSINSEYTVGDTPQNNSEVGVGILTFSNLLREMIISENVPCSLRYKLFREDMNMATFLNGLVVIESNGDIAASFEHWN